MSPVTISLYNLSSFDFPTKPYKRPTLWIKFLCAVDRWIKKRLPEEPQLMPAMRYAQIDTDDLRDMIETHADQIYKTYGSDPIYIVIGAKQFRELAFHTLEMSEAAIVGLPHNYYHMKLVVVPWIDGLFALPPLKEFAR